MNTEEGFILASLKEFVKLWGSGIQSSYHLECRNGQAWFQFGSILGSPGSQHFVPKAPVKDSYKKKKSPSRILKDRARAAAYRQAKASADTADVERSQSAEPVAGPPVSSPLLAVPASTESSPPPLLAAPATSPSPPSPVSADPADKQVQLVAAETAAELSVATTEHQPSIASSSVDGKFASTSTVTESSAGQVTSSSNQQVRIESEIIVHATAVIDDSRNETITPNEMKSVENIIFRENHLRQNIIRIQIGEQCSRSFRNHRFKHSIEYLILVNTEKLWESPRQYIWKHLGQLEWKQENGARMTFNKIHVK